MNNWQMAIAAGFCVMLVACSRRDGIFSLSPVFAEHSSLSASEVANCVVHRWKSSTRQLHRAEGAGAILLRAESFFHGVPIGLRVVTDGRHSRVEYFRQRRADRLYGSMVRGCLHPDLIRGAASAPAVPQS
ncbi:hypothetical protein [Burkholderia pseudomultivorans]|uniref:Lipoprotein n=3 Tax=Burkholderia pseudomultivorans TaxID=1207504 RepID=A0ABU2EEV3_9BURK|nr:hypothetical protein [Burkholderia pseudomultivorans]MDR8726098.1 hypothetical protein [Burkholderia pseudomultivorans]MDR8735006.1 hypothetical protein [Burkholderia pseudomultivorans]MDR8741173.1 hypothetical protein [Burkholderia pseudomultivorans]MDR8758058.1 hypothetical protein [Burkholderia pseudomultivorans]MDR8777386.1 hypothetical protein [Burkholderia pseudomultivorans]